MLLLLKNPVTSCRMCRRALFVYVNELAPHLCNLPCIDVCFQYHYHGFFKWEPILYSFVLAFIYPNLSISSQRFLINLFWQLLPFGLRFRTVIPLENSKRFALYVPSNYNRLQLTDAEAEILISSMSTFCFSLACIPSHFQILFRKSISL